MGFEEEVGKYQRYSREFKDSIVTKIMNRGDSTIGEVCAREGVKQTTGYSWLNRGTLPDMENKAKSKKWSASEKLQAVSAMLTANETETGVYLRKEGLHSKQLEDWRGQALASLEAVSKRGVVKDARDDRIIELEREVLRKDRALAEASALLILQKKVNLIWGDEGQK